MAGSSLPWAFAACLRSLTLKQSWVLSSVSGWAAWVVRGDSAEVGSVAALFETVSLASGVEASAHS